MGGRPVHEAAPAVRFGIRQEAFARPDARDLSARLVAAVTDAIAAVLGEGVRSGVTVELVGTPDGRTATGGVLT